MRPQCDGCKNCWNLADAIGKPWGIGAPVSINYAWVRSLHTRHDNSGTSLPETQLEGRYFASFGLVGSDWIGSGGRCGVLPVSTWFIFAVTDENSLAYYDYREQRIE
jgi:hypothetical protein